MSEGWVQCVDKVSTDGKCLAQQEGVKGVSGSCMRRGLL